MAIVGALGSILAVLANANGAIDGARDLWHRWTAQPTALLTTWQGEWKSPEGFRFGLAMELRVASGGAAEGEMSWQLLEAPAGNSLGSRVGATGIEYVSGTFNRAEGVALISGYKVSDPSLLGTDHYRFQIHPDKSTFIGMSKNYGRWEAQATGTVIVTEGPNASSGVAR